MVMYYINLFSRKKYRLQSITKKCYEMLLTIFSHKNHQNFDEAKYYYIIEGFQPQNALIFGVFSYETFLPFNAENYS